MDLFGLITQQLANGSTLTQMGKRVGANSSQVQQVVQLGLPALLQNLTRNASTPQGATSLTRALSQHQNDEVQDVTGFLKNVDTADGGKILQHIFGDRNQKVQSNLANQAGLDVSQVSGLLSQLAPLLLGTLGRQSAQQRAQHGAQDEGDAGLAGIASLLSQATTQLGGNDLLGAASRLLDADGDGDVMDDVGKMLGAFLKKPKK